MKGLRKIALLMLICMIGSALLTGCGGPIESAPAEGTVSDAEGTVSAKDKLVVGFNSEPITLDPAQNTDTFCALHEVQIYEPLLRYDMNTQKFLPCLATEWEINSDCTEVLFTIREGVTFHNGSPLTIDDCVYTINRAIKLGKLAAFVDSFDYAEKVDDKHMRLVLKYSYAPVLSVLTMASFGILNQAVVEETEAAGVEYGHDVAIGTGAYELVEWKSGDRITYKAYDNYWGNAPAIKNVEVILIADQSAGALALEGGEIDWYHLCSVDSRSTLEAAPNITVYTTDDTNLHDLTFNVNNEYFDDVRVRKAVALALNRDDILIGGNNGYGTVLSQYAIPAATGYVEGMTWYEQDIEAAKALLAEAGYPDGFDVVMTVQSAAQYLKPAEIVQAQLAKIGINVTFEKVDRASWTDIVGNQMNYAFSLRAGGFRILDCDAIYSLRLLSTNIGNASNYSGYSNPEFDALILAARSELDSAKRIDYYRQVCEMVKEDVPLIPLFVSQVYTAMNSELRGFKCDPRRYDLWADLYWVE